MDAGHRQLVVDAHVHIGTGDGLRGPWDTEAPLSLYLRRARPAGIRGAVIMAPLTSDYPRANADVARIIASRPGLLGYVFVNTRAEAGRVGERVAAAVRQGFCGIKVHAHDARITREVAEAARRWSLPVLYDPAGDTATVEMVVRAYPDVAWVVPHLSSFADDWKAQCAFVDQLVRLPNLFTDTSGVRYYDLLEDAVRRAGPRKVLFGSDGPFLHPAVELAKARVLPVDRDGMAQVLAGNVLRLTRPARARFRARSRARRRRRRAA
ncbi:amidohydrolase family protein [Nocardioides sp.]|uniref:amidohydrolase family protein n=1 Tax=Nocardioides sp. TaxID=35761 RepID=UPI002D80D186|nr:amidohydrolase family protein [Nocardioides sp.]HET8960648.1 amidohydrolase family protein [Nocardioides sp.]